MERIPLPDNLMPKLIAARTAVFVGAISLFGTAPMAFAQGNTGESLEQTYGRLCGKGEENEACLALRQALLTKLSGGAKVTTSENTPSTQVALPGQQLAGSAGTPSAATQAANAPYWGHYLDLLKEPRVFVLEEAWYDLAWESTIATYNWEVPGQVMSVSSTQADGSTKKVATLRWDEGRRAIVQKQVSDGSESLLVPQADGSFVQESETVRIIERKYNNGNIEQRTEVKGETGWELVSVYNQMLFSPASIGLLRDLHANAAGVAKIRAKIPRKYFDPEFQRQLQERDEARRRANGGFFRAVIGAGLGLAAANASGMDATQTLGAAAKGVALMNPESKVAQVIGASGDAVLQSSGLGTGASGTGSTGAGGGTGSAGFTKKTNLAIGDWCPRFTMQNYRTEALIKDANVQVRTMCGQAFEYYNMYENAIRQGYSEADCNRTYAAHEGATRNLKAFIAGSQ